MSRLRRVLPSRLTPVLLVLMGAAALAMSGCTAWRINRAVELARLSEPLQQRPADPRLHLLIAGDSTAVGTGASTPSASLAGLIARDHPRLLIENRARDGARFSDVLQQLAGDTRVDMVLVQAGGNDVIRLRDLDALQRDIEAVAERARQRSDLVVLMPAGNVGNAPFFFAPWSWWMTHRSRAMHRAVSQAAQRTGAVYVNLFHERSDDPFVAQPGLNAQDGLHPSDAGYAVWFRELMSQARLAEPLAAAGPQPR